MNVGEPSGKMLLPSKPLSDKIPILLLYDSCPKIILGRAHFFLREREETHM